MPWVKAADCLPGEGEQVLIFDPVSNRMEAGRCVRGRWYVEDARDGRLTPIAGVTHWAPLLESEANDDSDDD